MSLDRSLRHHGGLKGRRAVLTRAERITRMEREGEFDPESDSPFGLPKLRVHQSKAGQKAKKEDTPEEALEGAAAEGAEGEASAEEAK